MSARWRIEALLLGLDGWEFGESGHRMGALGSESASLGPVFDLRVRNSEKGLPKIVQRVECNAVGFRRRGWHRDCLDDLDVDAVGDFRHHLRVECSTIWRL